MKGHPWARLAGYLTETLDRLANARWVRRAYAVVVLLALLMLAWTAIRNWQRLSAYDWDWDGLALALSVISYNLTLFTTIVGWATIMRRLGSDLSLRKHWRVYTYTNIAKRLPSAIWYASGRMLMYQKMGVPRRITTVALGLEVVMVTYSGALATALLALVVGRAPRWTELVWIYAVLVICLAIVLKPQWMIRLFNTLQRRLNRNPIDVELTWRDLARWAPIYVLTWLSGGLMLYWMTNAIYPLDPSSLLQIVYMWTLSGVVGTLLTTFLPFSIGPREATLTALLSGLVPLPVATTVALLSRVWLGLNQLVWFGLSYLF
jgi:uncharacterized membrane protein YbhN (UPF0104 family)